MFTLFQNFLYSLAFPPTPSGFIVLLHTFQSWLTLQGDMKLRKQLFVRSLCFYFMVTKVGQIFIRHVFVYACECSACCSPLSQDYTVMEVSDGVLLHNSQLRWLLKKAFVYWLLAVLDSSNLCALQMFCTITDTIPGHWPCWLVGVPQHLPCTKLRMTVLGL